MSKKCRAYSESKLGLEPSDNRKAFYAGWEAALAEPVQPVAWLSRDDARLALWEAINRREFGNPTDDKLILDHLHQRGLWIGKYTAPPKRDPLTDEQISDLWHQSGEQPFKFARMLVK